MRESSRSTAVRARLREKKETGGQASRDRTKKRERRKATVRKYTESVRERNREHASNDSKTKHPQHKGEGKPNGVEGSRQGPGRGT